MEHGIIDNLEGTITHNASNGTHEEWGENLGDSGIHDYDAGNQCPEDTMDYFMDDFAEQELSDGTGEIITMAQIGLP